jgi:hypothetical protein
MLPRRRLSEVVTSSKVNTKICHLIVEGPSDAVVLRSYCTGEAIPVLIYYMSALEIDCTDHSGPGGERGRAIRISDHLGEIEARRLFCIVDRDHEPFKEFDLNSHCLMTDLSCVEIYPLDAEEFRGFVARAFLIDFSTDAIMSIFNVTRTITVIRWLKERRVSGLPLARIAHSLHVAGNLVSPDIKNWLTRSLAVGGDSAAWLSLESDLKEVESTFPPDHRAMMRVHDLDEVFRFWLHKAKGCTLPQGWVEQFLRGAARHSALAPYDFFKAVKLRCEQEIAAL